MCHYNLNPHNVFFVYYFLVHFLPYFDQLCFHLIKDLFEINVKVDLSNYATKADLKNTTLIDASQLASKSDLAILKTEVEKIDVDK